MSKRGGGDLNHENWDQDVEREEAGKFQAASADQMKGRVIRKARRRGGDGGADGEKKSAFGGFGGFAAPPKADAGTAFSFLAKPSVPEKSNSEGFSFGSSGAVSGLTKPPGPPAGGLGGGFSFGASSAGVGGLGVSKAAPMFGSFGSGTSEPSAAFGSKTTDTSVTAPSAASFSFGQTSKTSEKPEEEKSGPPANLFGSFGSSSTTTPSSTIPMFGAKSPSPVAGAGTFSFGKTTTSPEANEAPKSTTVSATSGMAFGSGSSAFSFGQASSPEKEKAAVTSKNNPVTANSGMAFGSSSSAFSFGQASSKEIEKSEAVSLGGTFSFGESKSEPVAKSSEKTISSEFSFGAKTDSETTKPAPIMAFGDRKSAPMAFGEQKSAPMAFGGQTANNIKDKNKEPASDEISKVCESNGGSKTSEYLSHIKALNIQVLAWLKMHIEKDPLIVLTPVFKDYDKHLEDIEKLYGASEKGTNKVAQVPPTEKEKDVTSKPLFGNAFGAPPSKEPSPITEKKSDSDSESKSSLFSFGAAASSKPLPAQSSGFSFGATAEPSKPTAASSPFSFGTASSGSASALAAPPATAGFSFKGFGSSSSTTPAETNADKKEETQDEEDTPPVVEVKQVEESDALYSKKCKLFYKKEGNYVEKGVGMLYLKSVDGGKTQLLIRADTNLGNVLLNILLSASMPTTRVGKNNVMLVCVPNPPVDPKADSSVPCPMLIR